METTKKIVEIMDVELSNSKKIFDKVNLYKHILVKDIDCSKFPDPKNTDGKELPEQLKKDVFSHIHHYDESEIEINSCPAVYVFELCDNNDKDRVIKEFEKIQKVNIDRTLPAFKNSNIDSKYLYVGKVEKKVGGRIVTHLGYYKREWNHGLQLAYWAKELDPPLKLNLHIFRFNEDFRPFIAAMEVIMAKQLNPLIGKH